VTIKYGLGVAALVLLADQIFKNALLYGFGFSDFAPGQGYAITSFFNVVMVWNQGVSFGLFPADSAEGRYFLIGVQSIVVSVLAVWLIRAESRFLAIAIGLVIGGAAGNVLDRVVYGAVADFLDFHAFGYHFYVFNVADAAIFCGVSLLIFESLFLAGSAREQRE
jgi:signal peptidase II